MKCNFFWVVKSCGSENPDVSEEHIVSNFRIEGESMQETSKKHAAATLRLLLAFSR
jgi:hypothetical protein